MKPRWIALAAAVASLQCAAAHADALQTSDGPQPAACDAPVQATLRADVARLAGDRNAADAWLVARTLLCGRGASARAVVAAHAARAVRYVMDGPDADPPRTLQPGAPELRSALLEGRAWGPTASEAGEAISLVARTNEICWAHFDLEFRVGRWTLVEIGGGCD